MFEKIDKTFYEITGTRLNNTSQLKLFNLLNDLQSNDKYNNIWIFYSKYQKKVKRLFTILCIGWYPRNRIKGYIHVIHGFASTMTMNLDANYFP